MQYAETPIEDAIDIIQSITCPDGKSRCHDGETCCKKNNGGYGCCPVPEGVCCTDGIRIIGCCSHADHCCGPHCCSPGETCCSDPKSCCPFPEGVCCEDRLHCCPHATECDIQHGRCIRSQFLPMMMGQPELSNNDPPMEKVSPFYNFWIILESTKLFETCFIGADDDLEGKTTNF